MERVLEPELMCSENAAAYANAALGPANVEFCIELVATFPEIATPKPLKLLDAGCGPGDIGIWLAQRGAGLSVTLLDASRDMLDFAARRVADAGLGERVDIRQAYVPDAVLEPASFDYVISNTFVHHVPEPRVFWPWARRLLKPDGGLFVRDLRRPSTPAERDALVELHAGDAEPLHKEDYRASLSAALTPAEVEADLNAAELSTLEVLPLLDRYWLVRGRI